MRYFFKKKSLLQRKQSIGWILIVPMLLALIINCLLPIAIAFIRSFYHGMGDTFVGFENYIELVQNRTFLKAITNLLLLWAMVLPLNLIVSFLLALLCHSSKNYNLAILFLLPAILPAVCTVETLYIGIGALQATGLFPFLTADWQINPLVGFFFGALVLWKGLGYSILIIAVSFSSIPNSYSESAKIDGASAWQMIRFIHIPLLIPAFIVCTILAIYNSFRCFREALFLGGAHPVESLYSLQHFLQNNFSNMNFARLEAASVLLVATSGIFFIALHFAKKQVFKQNGGEE